MKRILQPLAWYLVLISVLGLASGVALSLASATLQAHQHVASAPLALPVQH